MGFLFPYFFWLLASLALTIAIHFLNQNEVKPRFVGSVRFLQDIPYSKLRAFSLNQIPLLLLRLFILSLFIFLLANFYFVSNRDSTAKPIAFIHPSLASFTPEQEQARLIRTLDSLKENGCELRLITEGFPETDVELKNARLVRSKENIPSSYWSLLEKASSQFHGHPFFLFLPNDDSNLFGRAAEIVNPVQVNTYTVQSSYSLLGGELTRFDSLRVYISNNEGKVLFSSLKIGKSENEYPQSFAESRLSAFMNSETNNQIALSFFSNQKESATRYLFSQDTLRAAIVYDKTRMKEVLLAQMLIEATFYGRLYRTALLDDIAFIARNEKFDLVFWLNSSPISESKASKPYMLIEPPLVASGDKHERTDSLRLLIGERTFVINGVHKKMKQTAHPFATTILSASDGTPLIDVLQNPNGSLHLRIHFPLIENNFSFQPEFAELMGTFLRSYFSIPLAFKASQKAAPRTLLTAESLHPAKALNQEISNHLREKKLIDDTFEKLLWVALSLCIILERLYCFFPSRFQFLLSAKTSIV